jgi:hypothetical protein
MRWRNRLYGGVLAAVAVGLGACSQDSSMEPQLSPNQVLFNDVPTGYISVQKYGPAGTYQFEASATVPDPLRFTSFTVDAGGERYIWTHTNPLLPPSDLTVTELVPEGMQVDSIVVIVYTASRLTQWQRYTDTNSATAYGLTNDHDATFKFYNSEAPPPPPPPPPPGGTEGCTPGYWKQPHHFDSWVGYLPGDSFDAVFGVTYGGTLLQGLEAKGGGVHALARHAVAALLNASSEVDYAAHTDDVIAAVQAAFASGKYEAQKNIFERWNEKGCPLN